MDNGSPVFVGTVGYFGDVRRVLRVGLAIALLYAAAIAVLMWQETSLVYVGAGDGRSRRLVPDSAAGIPWDTVRVVASDRVPVVLLRSRVDDAAGRPWAIYLHGNAGFLGARANVARYELLRDAGFNVLAVEYRGYGLSARAGRPSEPGVYADATAAWTYLTRTLGVAPERVAVYGWSLGGGPATYLATEFKAAALITEGTFTALPDVGAELYPWIPVRFVMRNRFDNASRMRGRATPWIIFHGRGDTEVPFTHGEALAAVSPRAHLVSLDAGHDDGVMAERGKALAALRVLAHVATPSHRDSTRR